MAAVQQAAASSHALSEQPCKGNSAPASLFIYFCISVRERMVTLAEENVLQFLLFFLANHNGLHTVLYSLIIEENA
jgi:hypothetical protein